MKIKKDNDRKKNRKGMTLIEITLVISILLGLLSVLFIGIQAYKRGSDRAKCIMTLSTVQKVAISEANLSEIRAGETLDESFLVSGGYMDAAPDCPDADGDYTFLDVAVSTGVPYVTCNLSSDSRDHTFLN